MDPEFAIVTFRDSGPIKTVSAVQATNVHNARTKPLKHAIVGAPKPRFLVGTNNLLKDITRALADVEIDIRKPRKNGVLAYEAILSASAAFFDRGTEEERAERLELWIKDQVAWAIERYGARRVVSMVLHLDEKTPHIHLVILPLTVTVDGRRSDRTPRWGLVGRTISGPGMYDQVQDDYAAAMAHFGLVRGIKGSGRKHEPVAVYLARMAANERELGRLLKEAGEDRTAIDLDRDALVRRQAEHEDLHAQLLRDVAAEQEKTRKTKAALEAAIAIQAEAQADRAAAADELTRARALNKRLIAARTNLSPLFTAARDFMQKIDATKGLPLTVTAGAARESAAKFRTVAMMTGAPAGETRAGHLVGYANIRQQGGAIGA